MIDERFIELLLQQVDQGKAEKQALMDELKALRQEMTVLRAQNYEFATKQEALLEEFKARIDRLTAIISDKDAEIARLNKEKESIVKANEGLANELKLQRGKRFGRNSEKAKLLNNRGDFGTYS